MIQNGQNSDIQMEGYFNSSDSYKNGEENECHISLEVPKAHDCEHSDDKLGLDEVRGYEVPVPSRWARNNTAKF